MIQTFQLFIIELFLRNHTDLGEDISSLSALVVVFFFGFVFGFVFFYSHEPITMDKESDKYMNNFPFC